MTFPLNFSPLASQLCAGCFEPIEDWNEAHPWITERDVKVFHKNCCVPCKSDYGQDAS